MDLFYQYIYQYIFQLLNHPDHILFLIHINNHLIDKNLIHLVLIYINHILILVEIYQNPDLLNTVIHCFTMNL